MFPPESIVPEAFTGLGTLKLPFAATVTGAGPTRTSMSEAVWPHWLSTAVNQMVNRQLPAYWDAVEVGVGAGVGTGVGGVAVGPPAVGTVGVEEPQPERLRPRQTCKAMATSLTERFACRDDVRPVRTLS